MKRDLLASVGANASPLEKAAKQVLREALDCIEFTLDCGWTRQGSKQFIELPRMYRTARGARQAAALLAGETLDWKKPAPSAPAKPE